jgi:hypothetical protein
MIMPDLDISWSSAYEAGRRAKAKEIAERLRTEAAKLDPVPVSRYLHKTHAGWVNCYETSTPTCLYKNHIPI